MVGSVANAALNRPVVRSVFAVIGGNATAGVLSAVGGVLVARFVSPETAGSFKAYTIPMTFLTFLHLGTFDGLYRQLPLLAGRAEHELADRAAAAAGGWNLLVSLVLSAAFVGFGGWTLLGGDVTGALAWMVQGVVAWGTFYGGYLGATYRTLHNFAGFARIQATQAILSFGLVFCLPALGFSGLCLRLGLPILVGTWLLHRLRPIRVPPSWAAKPVTALMRVGLPYCAWGSLNTSLWVAAESSLVLAFGGSKWLGLWTVAAMIREGIGIVPQAAYQVMTPRSLEAYGRSGKFSSSLGDLRRVAAVLSLGMVGFAVVASYAMERLVPAVIPNYVDGIALMKVAIWSGVVQAATIPLGVLLGAESSWTMGRGILAGAIVFPLAAWIIAPQVGGVLAVAIGSLLGRAVRVAIGYWELAHLQRRESA